MDFFNDPRDNEAFLSWKQEVLDSTAHGDIPGDDVLLRDFVEGRSAHLVAYDADRDWEHYDYVDSLEEAA